MNNEDMASFICRLRKSKNLTQKQLAEKLGITDKAVSKWERGLGYPDITTLTSLAEILGVTTNELLNGKREDVPTPKADIIIQSTLQYAEKVAVSKIKNARSVTKFILTVSFILSIIVCVICDLAISQSLTWSLYPIISVVFGWLIIMPVLHFEKNPAMMSLVSLSIFVVPFLFFLEQIIGGAKWIIPLGIPISTASIIYLWVIWFLFAKTKINKWYASAVAAILSIPLNLIINFIISANFTSEPYFDVWDALASGIVIIVAIVLVALGRLRSKLRKPV